MTKIFLKRGKEESLGRRHPWVFSGAIERMEGEPAYVFSSGGISTGPWGRLVEKKMNMGLFRFSSMKRRVSASITSGA